MTIRKTHELLRLFPRKGYRFIAPVEWVEDPIVESQTLEIAPVDVSEKPAPILQAAPVAADVPFVLHTPDVGSTPSPVRKSGVSRLYWLLAGLLLVAGSSGRVGSAEFRSSCFEPDS